MSKPPDFEQACIIRRNVPYQRAVEHFQGRPMTEGVLSKGETVWIQKALAKQESLLLAYVDGLGIVSVDARYLLRAAGTSRVSGSHA